MTRLNSHDRPAEENSTTAEFELELISSRTAEHRGPVEVWT